MRCDPLLVVWTHVEAAEKVRSMEYNTYVKGKAYRICCEVECIVGKNSRMMTMLVHLWK